jgi:hypothetical protein
MMIRLGLLSYLRSAALVLITTLCLAFPGDAADSDPGVTLQWDKSIDDPYLQLYRVYYYTTPHIKGSLDFADRASSCVGFYLNANNNKIEDADCDTSGGFIEISSINTGITLRGLKTSKSYYYVVSSVDKRGLEGVPTDPELIAPLGRLTVNKQGKRGLVIGSPGVNSNINCGEGCSSDNADYAYGTVVTLTAAPDPGYYGFASWSGCTDGTVKGPTCSVKMESAKSVTVTFSLAKKGDVNQDDSVNLADAILIIQVLSRTGTLPFGNNYVADVNIDGKLGLADAIYILQKTAGLRF